METATATSKKAASSKARGVFYAMTAGILEEVRNEGSHIYMYDDQARFTFSVFLNNRFDMAGVKTYEEAAANFALAKGVLRKIADIDSNCSYVESKSHLGTAHIEQIFEIEYNVEGQPVKFRFELDWHPELTK